MTDMETRLHSLRLAKEWVVGGSLEEILRAAAIIEIYLSFGSNFSSVTFGESGHSGLSGSGVVNQIPSRGVYFDNSVPCEGLILGVVQLGGNFIDKPLSGMVTRHVHSSSQKENTCGQELPTPGSTERVIPDGGSVTLHGSGGEARA